MNAKEIKAKFGPDAIISVRNGVFTLKKSYFWGFTRSGRDVLEPVVKKHVPNAVIVDSGNHFHAFVGSAKAGSAQDSYFWIKFTVPQETT